MNEAMYDAIAKEYQESKQLPFRLYAESPTLFRLLGDVAGKDILDLACGEGIYTRKLKQFGARRVVGVDLSSEMIALAKKQEERDQLGIELYVHDAADLGKIGEFDIVVASYFLNYAESPEQLAAFCQTIYDNLGVQGRVVGMNDNPHNDPMHYQMFKTYGFTKSSSIPRDNGSPITYTFYPKDAPSFSFNNFYLHPEVYEQVFQDCGFSSFRWLKPQILEEGINQLGQDYWKLFEKDPPVIAFEALK